MQIFQGQSGNTVYVAFVALNLQFMLTETVTYTNTSVIKRQKNHITAVVSSECKNVNPQRIIRISQNFL